GLSAGDGGVPADLRPACRHGGTQTSVHRRLSAVRAGLGALRLCSEPAGAHRVTGHSRHRRGAAVVEQRRHRRGSRRPGAGRAGAIQSAAQAVGLSAGPTIGGLVLDALDWRWVFWINVPVGLAGTVLGWFVLPPTKDLPEDSRFDWKGAFLIAPALTALIAVLNEAYAWGATSPALLGCALLGVILLALFVRAEQRAESPLVDLTLFRQGAFTAGNVAGLMAYAALFGLFFLMPFMFVRAYRESAFAAGLRLTIVPVMLGAVAPLGGVLYDR